MDIKTLSDYDKYLSDIADWEGAITCIETAEKQGIKLVPTGDRLEIVPPEGITTKTHSISWSDN